MTFMNQFIIFCKQLNVESLDSTFSCDPDYKHNWKCTICNDKFQVSWNSLQMGNGCKKCSIFGFSQPEAQMLNFLKIFDNDLIIETENIFYLPNKRFRFKLVKMYWFGEDELSPTIHLNYLEKSEKENIRFIHIFEDEWIFKRKICTARIKHLLGTSHPKRVHARKCTIREIDSQSKNLFIDKFHIQGKDNAKIKIGAIYQDQLVSVMTFGCGSISKGSHKNKNIWELNRFCSDPYFHIPGIASKLLKYFMRNYDWQTIFSYADRRWSNANLYKKIGFKFLYSTKPNYWYVKKGESFQKLHRFGLRKKPDEPKNITEMVLRKQEGYIKFWDCGSHKLEIKKG